MKLAAELSYNTFVVFPVEQAGIIVPALSTAVMYSEEGYGANKRYKPTSDDTPIEFTFVGDDKFDAPTEVIVEIQKSRELSEKRWLERVFQTQRNEEGACGTQGKDEQGSGKRCRCAEVFFDRRRNPFLVVTSPASQSPKEGT